MSEKYFKFGKNNPSDSIDSSSSLKISIHCNEIKLLKIERTWTRILRQNLMSRKAAIARLSHHHFLQRFWHFHQCWKPSSLFSMLCKKGMQKMPLSLNWGNYRIFWRNETNGAIPVPGPKIQWIKFDWILLVKLSSEQPIMSRGTLHTFNFGWSSGGSRNLLGVFNAI